ncbi:hemolysin XhlA family protein [Paenibacillus sp. KQZ6P-2]|uniref:Hemolysin XhlA family protein n=1 Tax=Paenibacillus mangrovi TaxID=2931978 RepID=A0A9X1WZS3_9BACL|nr:hemolysin XhlA family protein [Paenibacillus mangrovi]MCJ8015214.1 hemolysin XhlA family protein [Paenibacillus mangrovi]
MDLGAMVALVSAISGIALGWLGRSRTVRKDVAQEAGAGASLHTDVEYIKRGVDDIKVDLRIQGQKVDDLSERVTRVEESAKQAHKRIDRLEE